MKRKGLANLEAIDVGILGVGFRLSLLRNDDGGELLQIGLLVDGPRMERREKTDCFASWMAQRR